MSLAGLQFIATPDEAILLAAVDAEPWMDDLNRRVQHYGYRYDYTARKVDPSMYLGLLPIWAQPIAFRLVTDGFMPNLPDQLIVNEYEPGQGINPHVDCVPCFDPVVCSITLGSRCVMDLSEFDGDGTESLLLERGSLLGLAGDARSQWRHGIRGRKSDTIGEKVLFRTCRVLLTFRTVLLER